MQDRGSRGGSSSPVNTSGIELPEGSVLAAAALGARVHDNGTTFSLWAPRATRVELALVDEHRRQTNHDLTPTGDGVTVEGDTVRFAADLPALSAHVFEVSWA